MFDDSHSTEIPRNQFIPCSTSEAVGIACRAALFVHVVGTLLLCGISVLLLGSEFWTMAGVALPLSILMVQFASFGVVMIPAAYLSAYFARAWFHESRFKIGRAHV